MIVVVEGVSAVGKTTWCATHGSGNVVAETCRFEPPTGLGDHEHAQFWHGVNCGRWAEAMTVEAECGLAICDREFPSEVPAAIERDRYDVDLFQLWMANLPRRP